MHNTTYILATDLQQCEELQKTVIEGLVDPIVMVQAGREISDVRDSDKVIMSGVVYKQLLEKNKGYVQPENFLVELTQLFSSTHDIEDLLEKIAAKSTEVLGDLAFIVLNGPPSIRFAAAAAPKNYERLTRLLLTVPYLQPEAVRALLEKKVLEDGDSLHIPNLRDTDWTQNGEIGQFILKHELRSLIATPILARERILGAFISISSGQRTLGVEHVPTASELSDFTGIALENARLIAELQRSATTDPLTGAYNARYFHEMGERETARTVRHNEPLSLLVIDADAFKRVNDTYGHPTGDKVLVEICDVLERTVRGTDLVCRHGGDEFGVILPGTKLASAMHVAEKILRNIRASEILRSLGSATVSIGASEYMHREDDGFKTVLDHADKAMFNAKRSGGNCARDFSH